MTPEQEAKVREEFEAWYIKQTHWFGAEQKELRWQGYLARAKQDAERIAQKDARIAELERKTAVCMGVGNGGGQLFVYGDYDSIKAAQAKLLGREELRAMARGEQAEARRHSDPPAIKV